ncbi:MAG: hypothetical protein ACLRMZ_12115 [Blautia marasmi]
MYEEEKLIISPLLDEDWNYFKLTDVPAGGHLVSIQYDKNGQRYGGPSGFQISVDGNVQARFENVPESVTLPIQKKK